VTKRKTFFDEGDMLFVWFELFFMILGSLKLSSGKKFEDNFFCE